MRLVPTPSEGEVLTAISATLAEAADAPVSADSIGERTGALPLTVEQARSLDGLGYMLRQSYATLGLYDPNRMGTFVERLRSAGTQYVTLEGKPLLGHDSPRRTLATYMIAGAHPEGFTAQLVSNELKLGSELITHDQHQEIVTLAAKIAQVRQSNLSPQQQDGAIEEQIQAVLETTEPNKTDWFSLAVLAYAAGATIENEAVSAAYTQTLVNLAQS